MELEKQNLTRLLIIHLSRNTRIEIKCENFSSFYEDTNERQRCLLDEYLRKNQLPYFDIDEIRVICPRFRQEKENKCEINGTKTPEEVRKQTELEELLKKFKERYQQD